MRSYNRLDVGRLRETATEKSLRDEIERSAKRARNRTSDRALPRFTEEVDGRRRIIEEPPLITRLPDDEAEAVAEGLDGYLLTLAPHWRRAIGGYSLVDVAHKVVGRGQRGPAGVRGPARGQQRRRRGLPAAEAGPALGAGPVRARRLGLARPPGPAGGGVPAGAADGERPAAGLDRGRRPAVLRAAVPQHEGHRPAGRDRRGRAGRLRRHRRPPAGQGSCPDQRGVDDRRRTPGSRTSWTGPWPASPGRTPTRPRPTTASWSRPCGPAGCRWPTVRWTGRAQPSGRPDRRRATYRARPMKAAPTTRVRPLLAGVQVTPVGAELVCGG